MLLDLDYIKKRYGLDNSELLKVLDGNINNIDLYDKNFDKDFYEKTYKYLFQTYENAYNDWKVKRNSGYLGFPFVENGIRYSGQILQDYIIINELYHGANLGLFVEFGACDGIFLSNTIVLEQAFDWNGLLIEGIDEYYNQLVKNRQVKTVQAVLYSEDGKELEFTKCDNLEVSGLSDNLVANNKTSEKYIVTTKKLETVLDEVNFNKVIHFMSVDVEGAEYDILRVFPFDKYKIYALTIEHGYNKTNRENIKKVMLDNNYILYKELLWDDIYVLPELLVKKVVNSFDFFDTLAHRFYIGDNSIIEIIAQKYNLPDFINIRKSVEMQTDGVLKDIYNNIYQLRPEWKELDLENVEFQLEKQYLIPNYSMINKLNSLKNTIIISDTFYSKEQLKELCDHFGIQTEIYVSRSGKKDGWIYKELEKEYIIVGHYGDNPYSDIRNALLNNINCQLIEDRHLTNIEKKLASAKMNSYTMLHRLCRLSNSLIFSDDIANIFLVNLLVGELLFRRANELGLTNILLTQRDCCHLVKIMRVLYSELNCEEFYTSRLAFKNNQTGFKKYYKNNVKTDVIIFDMNGTGYSTDEFCQKNQIILTPKTKMIFACLFNNNNSKKISAEFKSRLETLIKNKDIIDILEIINMDVVGRMIDYDFIPIRETIKYDITLLNQIHSTILKSLSYLNSNKSVIRDIRREINHYDQEMIKNIIIYTCLSLKTSVLYKIMTQTFIDDKNKD